MKLMAYMYTPTLMGKVPGTKCEGCAQYVGVM